MPMPINKATKPGDKEEKKPTEGNNLFWGICCMGGRKYSQVVRRRYQLTMAALEPIHPSEESSLESPFVSVCIEYAGCEFLLCTLKHNAVLQSNLNVLFDEGELVTFCVKGNGTVHLTGYHVPTNEKLDGIKAPETVEVSSTSSKINENQIHQSPQPTPSKVIKEVILDGDSSAEGSVQEVSEVSPKKVVDESASSPKTLQPDKDEVIVDDKDEEDHESDSNDSDDNNEVYDDDDFVEETDEDNPNEKRLIRASARRKRPEDIWSSFGKMRGSETSEDSLEELEESSTDEEKPDDLDSSIGRTPMPDKKRIQASINNLQPIKKLKMNDITPTKFNKAEICQNQSDEKNHIKENRGGIEVQDVTKGNGPVAKKGKYVQIYYIAESEDGRTFSAIQRGRAPCIFKLGTGKPIKGLDVGIIGMSVGGTRKITIPYNIAFGKARAKRVPFGTPITLCVQLEAVS